MRENRLRELIKKDEPSIGVRLLTPWPGMVEVVANTGMIDYVEFVGQYGPWDLHDLENIARATEVHNISSMLKVDQEPKCFIAQRALGSGFQSILFTDIRTVEDAKKCIEIVKPETPEIGGINGCHMRRNVGYVLEGASQDYVKAMDEVVIAIMVEKKGCMDNLEEILSLDGIDMVQFGPGDYSMSAGYAGRMQDPEVKKAELKTIETAIKKGKRPRVEIGPINFSKEDMKKYIDLGVKDFHLPSDVVIMHQWVKQGAGIIKDLF